MPIDLRLDPSSNIKVFKWVQVAQAKLPISSTDSIVTIDNREHSEKECGPIILMDFPIDNDLKRVHSENAASLILVTESGIVTDSNPKHLLKADLPILVTESGNDTDFKSEHSKKSAFANTRNILTNRRGLQFGAISERL